MPKSKPLIYEGQIVIHDAIGLTEHQIQTRFILKCRDHVDDLPQLWGLHATPNGGKRHHITAALLKAEGVKAGYPDVSLDVARAGYHGWRCEFKCDRNLPSEDQEAWIKYLRHEGYYVCVYWSADEAFVDLLDYLNGVPYRYQQLP